MRIWPIIATLALGLPGPALADLSPQQQRFERHALAFQARVAARLGIGTAGSRPRYGLTVTAEDGLDIVDIAPEQRFIPASNTKILTTAAAFATLPALDQPDRDGATEVRLADQDVVLTGRGGARLSSAPDCRIDCLATLADAVAAKTRRIRDVVGDATHFPDERWSPGMSWNNIATRSGTAIAALSLDDNEVILRVTPGAPGQAPTVAADGYFTLDNRAVTAAGPTALAFDRLPGSMVVRLTGTVAAGGAVETLRLGVDDPAHRAAWVLKIMLQARGVRVRGTVASRYRPLGEAAAPPASPPLASTVPAPLAEDLTIINKVSQNVHAELMLRRLGRVNGGGSIADGVKAIEEMMTRVGVPRAAWDLSDGSGMSSYNRIGPRAIVTLLRWIADQSWGAAFRATLPVGGVDGTLARRFAGTPLAGKIFAKTGTLNATNALAGYMIGKSGHLLTFAAYAGDIPADASATAAIDAALIMIAAEH